MVSDPETMYWDLMESVEAKARKVIELITNENLDEAIEILKNITK